jgi:hypothetical protein
LPRLIVLAFVAGCAGSGPPDDGPFDGGAPQDAPHPVDACRVITDAAPVPETCGAHEVGCPCARELEIYCDDRTWPTMVCIDGRWEGSFDTVWCTSGSCVETPSAEGCPCCAREFGYSCRGGSGSGFALLCRDERWRIRYEPGLCGARRDVGVGVDSGSRVDAPATDPSDAGIDDA